MTKEKRFEIKFNQKGFLNNDFQLIVDKETGVNYLLVNTGYGAGFTPLLDENGNVVVTK